MFVLQSKLSEKFDQEKNSSAEILELMKLRLEIQETKTSNQDIEISILETINSKQDANIRRQDANIRRLESENSIQDINIDKKADIVSI